MPTHSRCRPAPAASPRNSPSPIPAPGPTNATARTSPAETSAMAGRSTWAPSAPKSIQAATPPGIFSTTSPTWVTASSHPLGIPTTPSTISYLKIQQGPSTTSPAFHVWDKSGTYYELGCTGDSLQYWTDSTGTRTNYRWDVDKIVAPSEGPSSSYYKVILASYVQDSVTPTGGYTTIRDASRFRDTTVMATARAQLVQSPMQQAPSTFSIMARPSFSSRSLIIVLGDLGAGL